MSLLSKATFATAPKPLLWLAGILLLTTLAGAGATWYYRGELDDAETLAAAEKKTHETEVESLNRRVSEVTAANGFEHSVVEELARRLQIAVGQRQQAEQGLATAINQRDRARRERDRALSQFRQAQEAIYATDETCAVWGARPVCGRITDGVWQQWERARGSAAGEDGAGGDAGPAAGEDRPDADGRSDPRAGADADRRVQPAGVHAAHGMLQHEAARGDAEHRARLGQRVGGQPPGHPPRQRRGHAAAGAQHPGETAVTTIVLQFPDNASAAKIFDSLLGAGALAMASPNRPTIVSVTPAPANPLAASLLLQRMAERGIVPAGGSDET